MPTPTIMATRCIPSITTHSRGGHGWREKISELAKLEVNECALFVTGLNATQREECYKLLLNARQKRRFTVPFVHAVSSMSEDEFWFLMDTFGTEAFNLHPQWDFPLLHPLSANIRERIFIENCSVSTPLTREDLIGFAGLCLDLSHLEDSRRNHPENFARTVALTQVAKVGANHISGVRDLGVRPDGSHAGTSTHIAETQADFAYLAALPAHCFASVLALELENSLQEQLTFIDTVARGALQALGRSPTPERPPR